MSTKQLELPVGQLYDSRYSPIQARYNYTKSIQQIHSQLKKRKLEELKKLKEEEKRRQKELEIYQGRYTRLFWKIWEKTFAKLGEDWVILAVLGIWVAIISYTVDKGIVICSKGQMWMYSELSTGLFAKWVAWICLPVCLVLWNVGFTHLIAPQAAGSGIPQIKTSLRGVFMKEVLTFKVLMVKWIGLTATLGTGLPLGKEGPLIHMSSIIVTILSKILSGLNKIYDNESKKIEMLGAAWAVGVACCFNAPIGGVLFSVEITTAYFAVRNYWRGFFAAVWGATTYRLLVVWIDGAETITVVFKTYFFVEFPYDPYELISFALLGLICGLGGSCYIFFKQHYDNFANNNAIVKKVKKSNRFFYPAIIILIVATLTFPPGAGQFLASEIAGGTQVVNLFSNFSWTGDNLTVAQNEVVNNWTTPFTGIYANLFIYFAFQFIFSVVGSSLPIPSGAFIPNFRSGAALGRIAGELMHTWFPMGIRRGAGSSGVRYGGRITDIIPGAYAAVGAAAYAGAVTHTMSVCVILFEMTSSITHVIPVLIAVLIANGVARLLTPSMYDLVIRSKKLPYLPDLLPNTSAIYEVYVEDFMIKDLKFGYLSMSYAKLKDMLINNKKLNVFPLVDNPQTMTLLGSVTRIELISLLEKKIGVVSRRQILPSPKVFRHEEDEEDVVEVIPMRKKSCAAPVIIDDSSDSEKEEIQEEVVKVDPMEAKTEEIRLEVTKETKPEEKKDLQEIRVDEKRDEIFKKWKVKKMKSFQFSFPKSPMLGRRSPASMSRLEVPSIYQLSPQEQQEWEAEQLKHNVDFTSCRIDPAPFQLVERTSLLKVHSLFSLLAINFAYVTSIGKLVGVVGLKELRQAIEDTNAGEPPKRQGPPPSPLPTPMIEEKTIQNTGSNV